MNKKAFITKALKNHFDDGTPECCSCKDIFIRRLEGIYEKEKTRLTEENMDSILLENEVV